MGSAVQCLFIYIGWGQMYVRRCWISATGKIKDRRHKNEAVKVARQLGPEANISLSYTFYYDRSQTSQ